MNLYSEGGKGRLVLLTQDSHSTADQTLLLFTRYIAKIKLLNLLSFNFFIYKIGKKKVQI